jgi:4-hydroxy-tetrahydrodipicolinate reductase
MNDNIKIAIIGYGAMGKEIEKAAQRRNIEVSEIFDIDNPISEAGKYNFDVAIDFSAPSAVMNNFRIVSKLAKNIVIGTTAWGEHLSELKAETQKSGIACVCDSNFSIGMNIFRKIAKTAADLANKFTEYDIAVFESHHNRKLDSPSGTALSLGDLILNSIDRKSEILIDRPNAAVKPEQLQISSIRLGSIAGTHTIALDSPADTIELTHSARTREGFADGAVYAAIWSIGKRGFYQFSDILDS